MVIYVIFIVDFKGWFYINNRMLWIIYCYIEKIIFKWVKLSGIFNWLEFYSVLCFGNGVK